MDGATKRFGLNVKAEDGQTTLLDDRGLLQTWERGFPDNVDASHPWTTKFFLPAEIRTIKKALLRFSLMPFRAYETGAASGGGQTTPSAGTHRHRVFKWAGGGIWEDVEYYDTGSGGAHNHGGATGLAGGHNHGLTDHQHGRSENLPQGSAIGDHDHTISSEASHTHQQIVPIMRTWDCQDENGTWQNVGIGSPLNYADIWTYEAAGGHTHQISDHTHPLNFGIYEGTTPLDVTVNINGVDRTATLGGPFNSDQSNLDITSYLIAGWNTIELGSSRLGRLDVALFIQVLMGL